MNIIIFIAVIVALILVHELGHFLAAKKMGMRVDEFCIGFPPRFFSKQKGETKYSLGVIPLGGFVKIYGEDGEEGDGLYEPGSFSNKPRWAQAIVLFAGVFFNIVFAWVIFSLVLMSGIHIPSEYKPLLGEVTNKKTIVMDVVEKSPAEEAGLIRNDVLLSIKADGEKIKEPIVENINSFITSNSQNEVKIIYERNGVQKEISLTPSENIKGAKGPAIGILTYEEGLLKLSPIKAPIEGLYLTTNTTIGIVFAFSNLITESLSGNASLDDVAGPVGIFEYSSEAYEAGIQTLMLFVALISINLAIINMVPVPALDGGRLLVLGIEGARRKKLNPKVIGYINAASFAILILLMLVVTYNDIVNITH